MTDAVGSIDTSNAESGAEAVETTEAVTAPETQAPAPSQAEIAAQVAAIAAAAAAAAAVADEAAAEGEAEDVSDKDDEKADKKADEKDDADAKKADNKSEDVAAETRAEVEAIVAEAAGQDVDGDGDDDYYDDEDDDTVSPFLAVGLTALIIGGGLLLLSSSDDADEDPNIDINQPPTARDLAVTVVEDATITGTLQAPDPDADPVTFSVVGTAPAGLTLNPNGTFSFNANQPAYQDLNTGQTRVLTVNFQATDGTAVSNGVLTITINGVTDNFPPVAVDDTATTAEDTAVTINVLANDTDAGGGSALVVTGATVPAAQGTVVVNANNTITFTPAANFNGTANITYTVGDGIATDTGNVSVTVTPVNDAPVAADATLTQAEDTVVSADLSALVTDVDGGEATFALAPGSTLPAGFTVNADGSWTFNTTGAFYQSLGVGETFSYSFSFVATDASGASDTGTITGTVTGVNDAPVAGDDGGTFNENAGIITGNVLANDSDVDGDTLTVAPAAGAVLPPGFTVAANGAWSLDLNNAAYQSLDDGETATYTFNYVVSDGNGGSDTATVTFVITGSNDAPVVGVIAPVAVNEDASVIIDLVGGATDADGDPLTVTQATAVNGTVVINPNGTVTFTPNANFNGTDTISFTLSDGTATSNGTVTVNVAAVNDAPVAVDDTATTPAETAVTIAVLANDTDRDGDDLSVTAATSPNGVVVINADGTITFTPADGFEGDAVINYTVSDGNGGTDAGIVTVDVTPGVTSLDVDNDNDANTPFTLTINAADGAFDFVDDAAVANNVRLINFGADDTLTFIVDNASDVAFASGDFDGDGRADDVQIAINVNGVVSEIVLIDSVANGAVVFNESTAENAIGAGVDNFQFDTGGTAMIAPVMDQTNFLA